MKLFLRRAKAHDTGLLLAQNERWIDAKWSPDSCFLAVVDHPNGHIADVYAFYHTPNPLMYDVQWDIAGWHVEKREVVLKQEVRDQDAGTHATHTVVAKIGTKALKSKLPK